jgi:hypothetical protein
VAKVKKRAGVTGVRNVKAKRTAKGPARKAVKNGSSVKAAGKAPLKVSRNGKARGKAMRMSKLTSKAAKKASRKAPLPAPVVRMAVRELDPQRKCGEGTTVQFLYRVDETVDGRATAHLVFFDRHGWYCEHGRTCPAVAHAKKHNGHIARVS